MSTILTRNTQNWQKRQDRNFYSEKSQGEEGSRFVVYDVSLPDVYLKVEYRSDSYGDDKGVAGVQFVTAATKTVQEFKAIN